MESIPESQIKSKKRIGTLEGKPVIAIETIGGLHLVAGLKKGRPTIFGAAPHPFVARMIAEKQEEDLVLTELSKSQQLDVTKISAPLEAKYVAVTNQLNDLLQKK